MSNLIIVKCPMHKVGNVIVKVAYRRPGNVVVHVPVEFEVFEDKKCFRAVPIITRELKRLTQLPKVLSFTVESSRVYTLHKKDVVEDIVNELMKLKVIDGQKKKVYKRATSKLRECS